MNGINPYIPLFRELPGGVRQYAVTGKIISEL